MAERLAESMDRLGTETAFEVLARAKALEAYELPPLDPAVRDQLKEYVDRRRTELGD